MRKSRTLVALLLLAGCGGSIPPETSSFQERDALARAKACTLVGYAQAVGTVPTDERDRAQAAVAAEVSRARFFDLCEACAPSQPGLVETPPCQYRAWSCLIQGDQPGFHPFAHTTAVIVIWDGLPDTEYLQGEPLIHELLHVLGADVWHRNPHLWKALDPSDSAQAIAEHCFVNP